jgi:hypothetical protein
MTHYCSKLHGSFIGSLFAFRRPDVHNTGDPSCSHCRGGADVVSHSPQMEEATPPPD